MKASKAGVAVSRLIEAALLLVGIWVFLASDTLQPIALWDLLATAYLVIRVVRIARGRRSAGGEWLKGTLGRRTGALFTLLTSLVGVTAGLDIVLGAHGGESDVLVHKVFAVPAVLLAWAILHFGYAERYAQAYYDALPERLLGFPDTEQPALLDFAYFAFTLGTSFAVSDVETLGSALRGPVLAHSVLSFLYNTAILGIAISVLTGK